MTELYAGAIAIGIFTLVVLVGIAGMVVGKALERARAELRRPIF